MTTRTLFAMFAAAAAAMGQTNPPLSAVGTVTLPLDEYNRLLEIAGKPPKKADLPPLAYAIQSVEMKLRVEGETVAGTVQMEGEVFHKGQLKAPLVSGMTVLDAQQNGRPLPLVQEGGTHAAVLAGPAEFSIALQAGLPLVFELGQASFRLQSPAAGTVQVALTVPGEFTFVNVNPGLITQRGSSSGKTTVQATLVPGKPTTFWWASRTAAPTPAAPPKEARFLSDLKTLVSVSEADITLVSLADITVVQGEPGRFDMEIPAGFEITGATGASLVSSEVRGGSLILQVNAAGARSHEFLVSMTKAAGSAKADLALPGFKGSQRETGEVLVEGEGTMELGAAERGGLRRMDMKEGSAALRSLARNSVHAAYRYMKKPAEMPGLALEWTRFPDTAVLAAVAQQAEVTTLVTTEGRSLTEVKLTVRNQSQQFLRVALPAGASILSAEVAGVKVKPLTGADGERVPLLRPGFRPSGAYQVSYVFLHSGAPFAKKGGSELALPRMDMPIGLVAWEVFLPKQYKVADFGGGAIPARLLPVSADGQEDTADDKAAGEFDRLEQFAKAGRVDLDSLSAGQLGGYIVDPSGALVANANVTATLASGATLRTRADGSGRWLLSNVPSGHVKIGLESPGFASRAWDIEYDAARPGRYNFRMDVGNVTQTVEVSAAASTLMTETAQITKQSQQIERQARQNAAAKDVEASANVADLQKRVAGVLPIAVNVPRAGNSYRFVRPLVVDEETTVSFNYRAGK